MIFIGGISQGEKQLNYTQTVICDICGRYGRYQVFMTYMYFSFFFIPLFKWNKRFYVKMSCCGSVYELDPEIGREILAGRQAEITRKDLTLRQTGLGAFRGGGAKEWDAGGQKEDALEASAAAGGECASAGPGGAASDRADAVGPGGAAADCRDAAGPGAAAAEHAWRTAWRRRCSQCGYETDEDFAFCPKCGKKFE